MILSSMTACEAATMTALLYSVSLLVPSVHPNLKTVMAQEFFA